MQRLQIKQLRITYASTSCRYSVLTSDLHGLGLVQLVYSLLPSWFCKAAAQITVRRLLFHALVWFKSRLLLDIIPEFDKLIRLGNELWEGTERMRFAALVPLASRGVGSSGFNETRQEI